MLLNARTLAHGEAVRQSGQPAHGELKGETLPALDGDKLRIGRGIRSVSVPRPADAQALLRLPAAGARRLAQRAAVQRVIAHLQNQAVQHAAIGLATRQVCQPREAEAEAEAAETAAEAEEEEEEEEKEAAPQ